VIRAETRRIGAWYATGLLCLLYILSYVDRHILNLLVEPIRADLNISDTQMSLLLGASFAIAYAVFGLPLARLADNGNRVKLVALAVAFWSLLTIASGFARSFEALIFCRTGVALGEAALTPAALSIIADLFSAEQRIKGASFYMSCGLLGLMLSFIVGGTIMHLVAASTGVASWPFSGMPPWRVSFLVVGIPGLILSVLLFATVREPRRRGEAGAGTVGWPETIAYLKAHWRVYLPFFLGVVFSQFTCFSLVAWYPTVLIRQYGFTAQSAGWWFGSVGLVCSVLGTLLIPWVAVSRQSTSRTGLTDTLLVSVLAGGAAAQSYALVASPGVSIALAGVVTFFLMGVGVTPNVAVQVLAPNRLRGQLAATFMLFNNLLALAVGPTVVAVLSSRTPGPAALGHGLAHLNQITIPIAVVILLVSRWMFRTSEGLPSPINKRSPKVAQ
jgi:MFS family permease